MTSSSKSKLTNEQLSRFREISKCESCVHYIACPIWLSLLLFNDERHGELLTFIVPDIEEPCSMFFKHPVLWGKDETSS